MDFQNDAEYVGGCIAGGKRYLHINDNGDVNPCVFIHYSNANICDHTLLEALQSPIFMAYHNNMLFLCPMLEKPERANHLCDKCDQYARHWAPVAEELWTKGQGKRVKTSKAAYSTQSRSVTELLVMQSKGHMAIYGN